MQKVMSKRWLAIGAVSLLTLGGAGCGSDGASTDSRLESLSPVARDAFGAVITEAEPMRITTAQGTNVSMMGQNETELPDLDNPEQLLEVDKDGDVHQVFSQAGDTGVGGDPLEGWQNGNEMIWKVPDSYADGLSDASDVLGGGGSDSELLDSVVELFQPGEFRVDLAKVADSESIDSELSTQLAGTDVNGMFEQIAKQFDQAEPVDGDENVRQLDMTFGELQGAEFAEGIMDSLVGGADLPFDPSVMTDFIDDLLASPMVVTITLDSEGRVEQTENVVDMTDAMRSLMESVFADAGEAIPQDQIDALLDGLEMEITQVTAIDYDDSIEVEIPTGVTDDRTEEYIAFGEAFARSTEDRATTAAPETTAAA